MRRGGDNAARRSLPYYDIGNEREEGSTILDFLHETAQRYAKTWALSCVNPASWYPLAAGRKLQPTAFCVSRTPNDADKEERGSDDKTFL